MCGGFQAGGLDMESDVWREEEGKGYLFRGC